MREVREAPPLLGGVGSGPVPASNVAVEKSLS